MLDQTLKPVDAYVNKIVALDAGPIHPADGREARSVRSPVTIHHANGLFPYLHCDIDDMLDPTSIHDLQHLSWILRIQVVVIVNDRKTWKCHFMAWRRQHTTWMKVAEWQRHIGRYR